jgi:glutathione S-transferase
VTFPQFREKAATLPSGVLPVLDIIIDDISEKESKKMVMDQSIAILRYVGRMDGSLYPVDDPLLALQVDRIIDLAEDVNSLISLTVRGPVALGLVDEESGPWSKEQVLAIRRRMMDRSNNTAANKNVAFLLQKFEDQLATSTSGYLVGGKVTIADLRVHQLVSWFSSGILDGIGVDSFVESYPKLIALKDRVEAIPSVAAFRKKHGTFKYADFDYFP